MKPRNLNLLKIKKILLKKGYIIKKNSSLINLKPFKRFNYTILASVILIFSFGIIPSVIKLSSKLLSSPLTVENNSKLNFEKVLDGKNLELKNKKEESDKLKVTDLFLDIFEFQGVPDNTVRFSASTLEEIYKLAIKKGALGGKLLGAGGGGFVLFYVPKHRHRFFLKGFSKFVNIPFRFSFKGSEIIFSPKLNKQYKRDLLKNKFKIKKFNELKI